MVFNCWTQPTMPVNTTVTWHSYYIWYTKWSKDNFKGYKLVYWTTL